LSSEWQYVVSGALQGSGALRIEDGNHGEYRPRPSEFGTGTVRFIRAADLADGTVRFQRAEVISDVAVQRIRKGVGRPSDILLSHKGTVGRVALVSDDAPQFVCSPQTTFWRVLDEGLIDRRYLFAYLRSRDFQDQLDARKGETDMADYVSLTAQKDLEILLPPVEDQREIGRIVDTLDEKIALNRETSRTLEALAGAIFRSWFVDFDPVVAKAAGRPPFGMDAATAALFPDRFEDSPLGPIPAGWRNTSVGDVASINRSLLGPSDPLASLRYVEISGVDRGDITEVTVYPRGTEPSRARRRVSHGDTVLSTVRPERKAYFLVFEPQSDLIVSTGFAVVSPADVPWTLLHAALTQPDLFDELGRLADGGAYPAVNASVIAAQALTLPRAPEIVGAFHAVAAPLLERAQVNRAQNTTLAELRDLLLPKLLSGELRIRDAEMAVAMIV
jgi:type I restriction enzyme S subunit